MVSSQPTLHKPKSKIRLRLGLTPPHPKQPAPQSTTHLSPLDPTPIPSLTSSTSTTASSNTSFSHNLSRIDSRSAFTYDSATPSPGDTASPSPRSKRPEFDTISYNTQSPISLIDPNEDHQLAQSYAQDGAFDANYSASSSLISDTDGDVTGNPGSAVQTYASQPTLTHSTYDASGTGGENTLHPNIAAAVSQVDDIFSLTDQQLSERFTFITEIGFGNWGSVWLCKPKHPRASVLGGAEASGNAAVVRLGKKAAASGGSGAGGKVAIKLVHRSKTATTAARVKALWGEMKIIRSLRHEPHPSIIQFEAFVITPSYALVIMPHLADLIPVCLPPSRATPYFRQLASAVGYLHERGITHNDIKPANVLLSHNDVPVLVDFGFAQKWEVGSRGSFLSSLNWGTPEYLDPHRAKGMPHDERASDVWSLGITMFEILIGRTPFEDEGEEEQFATPDQLVVYYERSRRGVWIGEWAMPEDLEDLLRHMIHPDPTHRSTAMDAYHHQALQPSAPSVIVTPHFVRAAASFDDSEEPLPPPEEFTQALAHANNATATTGDKEKKKKRKVKKDHNREPYHRTATPTALGESIKQHTSVSKAKKEKLEKDEDDKENVAVQEHEMVKKQSKLVIKMRVEDEKDDKNGEQEDPTPTKVLKPAQPLRMKELAVTAGKKVAPRTSDSQLTSLSRPTSASCGKDLTHSTSTSTLKDKRVSVLSSTSTAPKSKDDAVIKTMRSLEGVKKLHQHHHKEKDEKVHDALAAVKRHAPEPPRPKSLDSAVELEKSKEQKDEQRRSLGLERAVLVEVKEEEVDIKVREGDKEVDTVVHFHHEQKTGHQQAAPPMSPPRTQRSSAQAIPTPSPQKTRRHGPRPHAELNVITGKIFPASDEESPLAELREKILMSDQEKLVRFRQVSGDLVETLMNEKEDKAVYPASPSRQSKHSAPAFTHMDTASPTSTPRASQSTLPQTKSVEALALDNRLDKMSAWIKNVEYIIEDARRALAEGREPGLPVLTIPTEITGDSQEHRFGVTPDKNGSLPAHLRTSSTQVEPSTPPKWMTYAEAEEKVRAANAWMEEQGKRGKKERPTVSHVLKLFGAEKKEDKVQPRSNTPDPAQLIALKPPATATQTHALRGAPSTPALRSSFASSTTRAPRVPLRKSESNLRNFNTLPVIPSASFIAEQQYDENNHPFSDDEEEMMVGTPRRVRAERMLRNEPGIVRQGEGWGSLSSGRAMMKPSSSMASLRDRARALLGDSTSKDKVDMPSHKVEKRSSRLTLRSMTISNHDARPGTPGAQSVMAMKAGAGTGATGPGVEGRKVKGWVKSLKGAMGMGKRPMDKVEEGA
ncbi:hypothetical protein CI109_103239 [Kwoniella shandongensis]|uniref:Uncharacterized protein n=1 Tax=Kwoniella shandongensis TaxID=1734106 RepID=A0A5M6C8U5_9TREE|nr:uncharacterized protein CI109_000429 [Kwoniella shandongensis]KAA5531586.1 hypothetical protein CI109_000429 [Kwoniella shandongensis]